MKEATETILRQWTMLQKIPRHPGSMGTRRLKDKLVAEGFQVDVRTIQRDLLKLSGIFPLTYGKEGKALRWCWAQDAEVMDIPGMEPTTALAFRLAEEHLAPLLPQATLKHLEPHFRRAKEILEPGRGNRLGLWPDKVCTIVRGPELLQPAIRSEVQDAVYKALLDDRQLEVAYRAKKAEGPKSYALHPLGLVFREGIAYLVCTVKDYKDIRHLALHRMEFAKVLDSSAHRPKGFDLRRYVRDEEFFAYPLRPTTIQLKVLFGKGASVHLSERPLSKDQRMTPRGDNRVLLQATVKDTLELRWWLRGFGDKVEVLAPKALREEFKGIVQRMAGMYKRG